MELEDKILNLLKNQKPLVSRNQIANSLEVSPEKIEKTLNELVLNNKIYYEKTGRFHNYYFKPDENQQNNSKANNSGKGSIHKGILWTGILCIIFTISLFVILNQFGELSAIEKMKLTDDYKDTFYDISIYPKTNGSDEFYINNLTFSTYPEDNITNITITDLINSTGTIKINSKDINSIVENAFLIESDVNKNNVYTKINECITNKSVEFETMCPKRALEGKTLLIQTRTSITPNGKFIIRLDAVKELYNFNFIVATNKYNCNSRFSCFVPELGDPNRPLNILRFDSYSDNGLNFYNVYAQDPDHEKSFVFKLNSENQELIDNKNRKLQLVYWFTAVLAGVATASLFELIKEVPNFLSRIFNR
ncbi:MAG: hypothetical protein AABX38_03630 [Candidatus Micrarchaeota archaeon]